MKVSMKFHPNLQLMMTVLIQMGIPQMIGLVVKTLMEMDGGMYKMHSLANQPNGLMLMVMAMGTMNLV